MAVVKKISELTPKGANLANNDLLIVGVSNGTDYDLKSVTGAELLSTAVSQTITNGVTTTAPSQDAVYDALQNKVDKVTGSRLITSAEGTILSNTSGTNTGDETSTTIKSKLGITTLSGSNTGDQDLQQVTDKGSTTTNELISNVSFSVKTNLNQILGVIKRNTTNTAGELLIADTSGNATTYKINEITKGVNSIVLPSSSGTLALTSDLSSYAQTSQVVALTGNQTVGGVKTFTNNTTHDSGLKIKHGSSVTSTGYTGIGANVDSLIIGVVGASQTLQFPNTNNFNYTFPASNGTLATTSDLTTKVDANSAITGATKTKITYDSKGLVTAGADATTADIADSLNKRYVTDANLTTLSNTSGTNTGDQIISDATLTTSDITTNNVSTTKHGFVPKAPNNTTQFLRGDGTWATPASGSSGGVWGIANSSGVYTYYATWALAVAAATSGQVIELFADITENSVGYTLKNGVNVNGNGHTIIGTTTATFNDAGLTVVCDVSNLIISKSSGGALSMTSTSSNITGNCKIISTDISYDCCIVYGQLTGWSINGSVNYPIALYSTGILNYININTTGSTGIVSYSTTCKINNCVVKTAGNGITSNASNGGIVNNCTVNTNGSAISIVTGEVNNCSATSNTSTAIGLGANSSANNCYGRSAAGVACVGVASSTFNNCEIVTDANVTGTSTPNYYNCKLWSKADWVLNGGGGGKIVNCTIISNYNGPVIREATTGTYIVDCYFEVTNTGATPIFSSGTPTLYIKGNSVKGTTNFKSAGIVQGQTNTADAQGNIILN